MWCNIFCENIFQFSRNDFSRSIAKICKFLPSILPELCDLVYILDLQYFFQNNPFFYHLNLIPCHCWSWKRNIYFLVNTFVRHNFPMSKSSITESTELLTFKRQKDGYKVTVNIVYLCRSILRRTQSPEKFTYQRLWNIHGVPTCRHRLLS